MKKSKRNRQTIERPAEPEIAPPLQTVRRDAVTCPYCHTSNVKSDGNHGGMGYYLCLQCAEPETCSRRRFQVRIDRTLASAMPEGTWRGRRCVIFGGGASAHRFDWSRLKARDVTIAINDAWMHFREHALSPTLSFSGDQAFWKERRSDVEYKRAVGLRVALEHGKIPDDVLTVPTRDDRKHWARRFEDGVRWGKNSGVAAINLAEVLGADEVYLVGFDLDGRNRDGVELPGLREFHDGFRDTFEEVADLISCVVHNTNPASTLRCFPVGRL